MIKVVQSSRNHHEKVIPMIFGTARGIQVELLMREQDWRPERDRTWKWKFYQSSETKRAWKWKFIEAQKSKKPGSGQNLEVKSPEKLIEPNDMTRKLPDLTGFAK